MIRQMGAGSKAVAATWAMAISMGLTPACTCEELPSTGAPEGRRAAPPAPTKPTATGAAPAAAPSPAQAEPLPSGTEVFRDEFERVELGPDWSTVGAGVYAIEGGELVARMGHNRPLWLARKLPRDARIDLDCWSNSPDGDLKVEAWGDGRSHATHQGAYTSTAYNFIFGGWKNQLSVLARMDEHGNDRQVKRGVPVEKGRRYHFTIVRKGGLVDWRIDGQPFLRFEDASPLEGSGHEYFAFNDWEAELHFDNLVIQRLD